VPARVIQADAGALAHRELRHQPFGLRLHVGFDRAPRAVEVIEPLGDFEGAPAIVGRQALDPAGSCRTRRPAAFSVDRAETRDRTRSRAKDRGRQRQRGRARLPACGPRGCASSLRDQDAIVEIERHDVCDRAERDKVEHAA